MKIFIFFIFILSLFYLAVNPQLHSQFANPGSITWERTYENQYTNLINWDGGWDVCEADSGNFYIAGHTIIHGGIGGYRIWMLKINPYGDTIWTRIIGNTNQLAKACAPSLMDGGCVLTGDGSTPFMIKLDRSGNIVWNKTYPGSYTQAYKMINTSDGGYAACGRTSYDSAIVFKIDSLGDLEWMKKFGTGFYKRFRDIKQVVNGIIITGNVRESNQDTLRPIITKLSEKGELYWEKKYFLLKDASSISINDLGEQYLIGGTTTDSVSVQSQNYIMRTDTSGSVLFYKIFHTEYPESLRDIGIINKNKYIIASFKNLGLQLYGRGIIVDSVGVVIIEKDFPTPSFIELRSVLPIINGDIIFAGVAEFSCSIDCERVYAVRTDSILNYNPLGISSSSNLIPFDFRLYPAYPNPFNPATQLKFDISKKGNVKIKIYDIAGRVISEILNQDLLIGQHSIEWNASSQSSGVYFAVLYFENKFVLSQKLILTK